MELHSPTNFGKRLWNILRIAFYMMRKGLVSKRKLIMDISLMMKRGKTLKKSLGNLMFHHHYHSKNVMHGGVGIHHYEFSCSNSPNPVSFHLAKRKHHHFLSVPYIPCINFPDDLDEPEDPKAVVALDKIEYTPEYSNSYRFSTPDLAPGEKMSPLKSPFSVRVSNYSSVEEENDGNNGQVNNDAEDFIKKFYEQLRVQSRTQLLKYQEMQYQEMLARGT